MQQIKKSPIFGDFLNFSIDKYDFFHYIFT